MIRESDINITSANIKRWQTYLEEAKDLNAFVKSNFGKEEIAGMSIAPIIKQLHRENEIIERAVNAYKNRNGQPFEIGAYYATEYDSEFGGRPTRPADNGQRYYEVIHILKGSSRGKKCALTIERFKYHKYAGGSVIIDANGPSFGTDALDWPMNTYTDLFHTGRLVKVSDITWEQCCRIYDSIAGETIDIGR